MTKSNIISRLVAYFLAGILAAVNILFTVPVILSITGTFSILLGIFLLLASIGVFMYTVYSITECFYDMSQLNAVNKDQ